MRLTQTRILDRGEQKERIAMVTAADVDLKFYVVMVVKRSTKGFENLPLHTYWFIPKSVKTGDHIVLCTGEGTDSEKKNNDGTTSHFLYWGLPNPVFSQAGRAAVVVELDSWNLVE